MFIEVPDLLNPAQVKAAVSTPVKSARKNSNKCLVGVVVSQISLKLYSEVVWGEERSSTLDKEAHVGFTEAGRAHYKRRKAIVEPVFGWVKQVLGFRRFSLRGIEKVTGEWDLVCLAVNLKRMNSLIRWI